MKQTELPEPNDNTPKWAGVEKAKHEDRDWLDTPVLRGQRQQNHLILLKFVGHISIAVIVILASMYIIALGILTFHYLAPETLLWLSDMQKDKIQSILFSGTLGSFLTLISNKYFARDR